MEILIKQKRFDVAVASRNFEIDLFWKRSLFFWGFISAAFIGFATARASEASEVSVALATFGAICSAAWTLVNRGSKYWQEAWEQKVERSELQYLGAALFAAEEDRLDKGVWLSARKYSVTKLAIALSDYIFLLWLCFMALESARFFEIDLSDLDKEKMVECFLIASLGYLILILWSGRKSPAKPKEQAASIDPQP
ncbi:MAG: hypothetical protein WA190_15225 [Usitatibacter sp.]